MLILELPLEFWLLELKLFMHITPSACIVPRCPVFMHIVYPMIKIEEKMEHGGMPALGI